ncbi:TetR/AcrR family transcriptional regulator [Mycetocola reblochoni]|uniref:TetR/AcrR family transcriptional regulator n=1 Tax=Mycetocola reblochoni TaxID=331618 RepID=UPI003F9CE163
MPRLIDHEARAAALAEAAWRVLARDGILRLSVRNVAEEAGLATASLRRAIPTQTALRAYCLTLVSERVPERFRRLEPRADVRAAVEDRIAQLLPLDAERRLEMEAFIAIGVLALTDEELQPHYRRAHDLIAGACVGVVTALRPGGAGSPAAEAARLHALIDGLALHLVQPKAIGPDEAMSVLALHLDELAQG